MQGGPRYFTASVLAFTDTSRRDAAPEISPLFTSPSVKVALIAATVRQIFFNEEKAIR